MKTTLVQIGNSRGIFIRRVAEPRSGWDEAFRQMHEYGDDALLDKEALSATAWDTTEWEW